MAQWWSRSPPTMWPMCTMCHKWVQVVVGSCPCSEGFSPGSPVCVPPQKSTFLNSNSTGNSRATGLSVVWLLCVTLVKQSWLIDLFYLNQNNQVGIYRLKTYKILLVWASLFLFFKDDSETERERERELIENFFIFIFETCFR